MHLTINLKEAIAVLKKGGVIVYPTDTAYGLGAKFSDKKAAARIYKIKGRPGGKPLPVIVAGLTMARKFFKFSPPELALAKKYWPGALSLVLLLKRKIKYYHTPEYGSRASVVVRVPNSKIARQLSRAVGEPIFSTSANLSGAGECYSPREVIKQFADHKHLPDLILDAGRLRHKKPSTIIEVIGDKIEILRQGPIMITRI